MITLSRSIKHTLTRWLCSFWSKPGNDLRLYAIFIFQFSFLLRFRYNIYLLSTISLAKPFLLGVEHSYCPLYMFDTERKMILEYFGVLIVS